MAAQYFPRSREPSAIAQRARNKVAARRAKVRLRQMEEAAQPAPPDGMAGAQTQAIVSANIFSASRKAPRTRYRPFAAEVEPGDAFMEPAPPVPEGEAVPQLSGIMVGPGGASALRNTTPFTMRSRRSIGALRSWLSAMRRS